MPVVCKKCHRRTSTLSESSALTASGPEVPVASAASQWGSEKSMLLMRKMLCRSKPKDQPIVSVPHEHHDEYDDDDLPNLCQHYRGRATVGSVRGERRHTLSTLRRRLLPGPRPPSRVVFTALCETTSIVRRPLSRARRTRWRANRAHPPSFWRPWARGGHCRARAKFTSSPTTSPRFLCDELGH